MTDELPRRELLKSAALAGGVSLLASGLVSGQDKTNAKDKPVTEKCAPVSLEKAVAVVPTAIGAKTISVSPSLDKLAQTVTFDSLQATYGPEQAARTFTPVKAAFLEVPVAVGSDPQCELLGYTVDVRGSVDLTAGARGSVAVIVGGEAHTLEFPFDTAGGRDFNKRLFAVARMAGTPGKIVVRSPLQIQIILAVETATPGDAALLTVSSLDLEARRAR